MTLLVWAKIVKSISKFPFFFWKATALSVWFSDALHLLYFLLVWKTLTLSFWGFDVSISSLAREFNSKLHLFSSAKQWQSYSELLMLGFLFGIGFQDVCFFLLCPPRKLWHFVFAFFLIALLFRRGYQHNLLVPDLSSSEHLRWFFRVIANIISRSEQDFNYFSLSVHCKILTLFLPFVWRYFLLLRIGYQILFQFPNLPFCKTLTLLFRVFGASLSCSVKICKYFRKMLVCKCE